MNAKWMGIVIATMGIIFGVSGKGICDTKGLLFCGVEVVKDDNIDLIKRGFEKSCKIIEIDNNNLVLNDQNGKIVGSIFHQNNKVVRVSRRWDIYAVSTIDEMDALIDAIGSIKEKSDDVLVANLVVTERKDPAHIFKELTFLIKGKRFTVSTGRIKGNPGASTFVTIDEQLE
jgi:hypothetical protein